MRVKFNDETYNILFAQINEKLEQGDYEVYENGNEYRLTINGCFLKMTKFGGGWIVKYYLRNGDVMEFLCSEED